jgi:predicted HAD superfamily hydrolase
VEKGVEAAKRLERHLESIASNVVTKDTMAHFISAGMEMMQAANTTMNSMEIPKETKDRVHKAEKELLLAMRSAIDVVITELDKEMPAKASEIKRIEIKKGKPKSR